eukprot:7890133-Alexandrium_andersonii.AAC.1
MEPSKALRLRPDCRANGCVTRAWQLACCCLPSRFGLCPTANSTPQWTANARSNCSERMLRASDQGRG